MSKHYYGFSKKSFEEKLNLKTNTDNNNETNNFVEINNAFNLTDNELLLVLKNMKEQNFCLFRLSNKSEFSKSGLLAITSQLGLQDVDGNLCAGTDHISEIQNTDTGVKAGYIPYSNKKLSWHTDGYYNKSNEKIKGMVLFCMQEASTGGETLLCDHEKLFFELYKINPDYIDALMEDDVLTIPENQTTPGHFRAAQHGSVFTVIKNF